jgi:hypothetical protein
MAVLLGSKIFHFGVQGRWWQYYFTIGMAFKDGKC